MWNFCRQIDDTAGFCNWVHTPKNPRGGIWIKETYGRHVQTAYDGIACETSDYGKTSLKMSCPSGGKINVELAQYGRWNTQTCAADMTKNYDMPCQNYIDVLKYAKMRCNGKEICEFRADNGTPGVMISRLDPCSGVPKYVRVKWICSG